MAVWLDLPGSGYASNPDAFHWSVAMNADGTHLYAANGPTGTVEDIGIDGGFPNPGRAPPIDPSQTGGIFWMRDADAQELGGSPAAANPRGTTLVIREHSGR